MAFARRGAPRPGRLRRMGRPVLIAVLVLAVWWGRRVDQAGQRPDPGSGTSASSETHHGYQVLEGARLVDHRRNDGDSFFIDHRGVERHTGEQPHVLGRRELGAPASSARRAEDAATEAERHRDRALDAALEATLDASALDATLERRAAPALRPAGSPAGPPASGRR